MGSGTKRKPADRLRINQPMTSSATSAGASGTGGAPEDINNVCPITIRIKLRREDLEVGTKLSYTGDTIVLESDTSVVVGSIPSNKLKIIQECLGMGIEYPSVHVFIDKKGDCYAEFTQ